MKRIMLAFTVPLVCMAASLGVGLAIADDSKALSPIDELGKFVGDGTCTGNVSAVGKSSGHATTGKYHGEKTLDGMWIVIRYDEDKTDVTLEYTTSIDGNPVSLRDVFTHTAAENSHTGMMRDQKGEWVKTDKETCKST